MLNQFFFSNLHYIITRPPLLKVLVLLNYSFFCCYSSRCLATSTCLCGRATPGLCTRRLVGTLRNSHPSLDMEDNRSLHPSNVQYTYSNTKRHSHVKILTDTTTEMHAPHTEQNQSHTLNYAYVYCTCMYKCAHRHKPTYMHIQNMFCEYNEDRQNEG